MSKKNWIRAGLYFLAALLPGLFLSFLRYDRLGDPIVDFGSELYVAWRIKEGAVLYQDLFYYFGPFGPYFNALVMSVFGESRTPIIISSLSFFVATLGLVFLSVSRYFSNQTAAIALIFVTLFFGFNQFGQLANYNFLTPYRFGVVYGLFFSLATVWALDFSRRKQSLGWACMAGFFLGLSFLNKSELFLAVAGAIFIAGATLALLSTVERKRLNWRMAATLALGFLLIVSFAALFWSFHARELSFESVMVLLRPYLLMLNKDIFAMPFYQRLLGQGESIDRYLYLAIGFLGFLGLPWLIFAKISSLRESRARLQASGAFLVVIAFVLSLANRNWPEALVHLIQWQLGNHFLSLAIGTIALILAWRSRDSRSGLVMFAIVAFACGLTGAKVLFSTTLNTHYGFVLGLPAGLLIFLFIFEGGAALARRLKRPNFPEGSWKIYVLLLLLPQAVIFYRTTEAFLATKTERWEAKGAFQYNSDEHLKPLDDLFSYLGRYHDRARTVTVLPDGSFLNFVTGKPNPLFMLSLLPDQVMLFGEQEILRQMSDKKPDLVLLYPSPIAEFGMGNFPEGYGKNIYYWIRQNYRKDSKLPALLSGMGVELYLRPGYETE